MIIEKIKEIKSTIEIAFDKKVFNTSRPVLENTISVFNSLDFDFFQKEVSLNNFVIKKFKRLSIHGIEFTGGSLMINEITGAYAIVLEFPKSSDCERRFVISNIADLEEDIDLIINFKDSYLDNEHGVNFNNLFFSEYKTNIGSIAFYILLKSAYFYKQTVHGTMNSHLINKIDHLINSYGRYYFNHISDIQRENSIRSLQKRIVLSLFSSKKKHFLYNLGINGIIDICNYIKNYRN